MQGNSAVEAMKRLRDIVASMPQSQCKKCDSVGPEELLTKNLVCPSCRCKAMEREYVRLMRGT